MTDIHRQLIPERPGRSGGRLGRHVNHDPRSRQYAVAAGTYQTVQHDHLIPVLDQGDLGSCTAEASVGWCGTDPNLLATLTAELTAGESVTSATGLQKYAVSLYSLITASDDVPGQYPPTDTGSDGLSAAKTLVKLGLASGYQHAFSIDAALTALQTVPVMFGTNWYPSMDSPDTSGVVKVNLSKPRGGHEYVGIGMDVTSEMIHLVNSWGPSWGAAGHFYVSFDDMEKLLARDGDVTVPTPLTVKPVPPSPTPQPVPVPVPVPVDSTYAQACQALAASISGMDARHPHYYQPFWEVAGEWLAAYENQ